MKVPTYHVSYWWVGRAGNQGFGSIDSSQPVDSEGSPSVMTSEHMELIRRNVAEGLKPAGATVIIQNIYRYEEDEEFRG